MIPYYYKSLNSHTSHMTITTTEQIWSGPDYLNEKANVNINLQDLCETLVVSTLFSTV